MSHDPATETRRILKLLYEWLVLHVTPRLAIDGWFPRGLWYDRKYPSSGTDVANLMLSAPVARSERVMRIVRDAMA